MSSAAIARRFWWYYLLLVLAVGVMVLVGVFHWDVLIPVPAVLVGAAMYVLDRRIRARTGGDHRARDHAHKEGC